MRKLRNFLRLLFYISLALLIAQQLFAWYYFKTFPKEEIEALFEPITSKYDIKIVYEIGNDFFSPLRNPIIPAGPHRDSKVKPIRHRVLVRYPLILQKALEKYPIAVIKNYLKSIYFVAEIDHDGLRYGGTYDPFRRIIYLVDDGEKNDDQAMSTFHHEFSSLLLKSHSFWIDPWIDYNPNDFKYFDDIYSGWKEEEDASKNFTDEECYENGFVTDYGLTNFENDFNEYSEMIFTYPGRFKKIMSKYPRVRGKFRVWLEFYQKIDPIFTEENLLGNS